MNEDNKFDIIVSFHMGDKETAEKLSKKLTAYKDKMSVEELILNTLYLFGAVKVTDVVYSSTQDVGHVALGIECSTAQQEKNKEEADKASE